MPTSVALAVALPRRSLCAAVTLALSLTCIGVAISALATPMAGMAAMAGTATTVAGTSAPAVAGGASIGGHTGDAVGVAVREAVSPVASVMSACVTDVSAVCTIDDGLTAIALLALLLAPRRDTFLGLLARTRPRAHLRRRRRHTPWKALSPVSLCVLRV